jgi:hypothetical protein
MVAVPFSDTLSSNLTLQTYELNLSKNTDPALSTLATTTNQITTSTGIPLSAFNFLNSRDYGNFYHVADSSTTVTYLLSYFILSNINLPLTSLPPVSAFPSSPVNYQATGDKLCYGSVSQGVVIFMSNKVPNPSQVKLPLMDCMVRHFNLLDVLHVC